MEANHLVSVIIPCYNVEAYVEKAIRSILAQTYTHLEILIIDDGSIDDTLNKIKSFDDSRIRVVAFEENTKKIGAVNSVLKEVKGDLICFQDADDWSEPPRLWEQVQQFMLNPALGICFCSYRNVGDKAFIPKRIALSNEELRDEFLEFGNKKNSSFAPTSCPTMMISKDSLLATAGYHPYFKDRVAEDIHWVYRILKIFPGITINKPLYNYASRPGSFTQIQFSGKSAKYAYSWQLLSKIIYQDLHENTDVLSEENKEKLRKLELQACEEALVEAIRQQNLLKYAYQNSRSYRLGNFLLSPFRVFNKKQ